MRVLHIGLNDYLGCGGTGIATYRLHHAMRQAGADSKILSRGRSTEDPTTAKMPRWRVVELPLEILAAKVGLRDFARISTFKIKQHPFYEAADVVTFHGIHSGTLSYLSLPSLTADKPGVFVLHDMWAFTGHCAASYECTRWQTGCGDCPHLDINPRVARDTTRLHWKLKDWTYRRSNLTVVAPSTWMAEQARKSMLGRFPVHHIPHGVDTAVYQPLDPAHCRSALGLPPDKKVLMFAAVNLRLSHSDGRGVPKGADLLLKALMGLPAALKAEMVLLTIGNGGEEMAQMAGISVLNLGYVVSDHLKAIAYSAADVFVSPTRAESFGLVLLESMACGTPVVSFRVGGVPDLVRPGVTGYLAEPENADDLRVGIVQLLEDDRLRARLGEQGRALAEVEFTLQQQAHRYLGLYRGLLEGCTLDAVSTNAAAPRRADL
ncbi:MAG: glycosyltransferase [Pseudomonadota bacterium]